VIDDVIFTTGHAVQGASYGCSPDVRMAGPSDASPMSTSTRHFIRHYLEMIAAMIAGMVVLGIPGEGALHLIGSSSSQLQDDAPAVALLAMATIMTIPMVALMRYRGHAWRPCWEMSASMFIPTFGAIAALGTGISDDFMGMMMLEHAAMLPAMLVAMLLRYDEYAGCGHAVTHATA
jgi:flagellar biosynthetic protein FliP